MAQTLPIAFLASRRRNPSEMHAATSSRTSTGNGNAEMRPKWTDDLLFPSLTYNLGSDGAAPASDFDSRFRGAPQRIARANAEAREYAPQEIVVRATKEQLAASKAKNGNAVNEIGAIIGRAEGNYESYNSGTKGVRGGEVASSFTARPRGTVTGKTINQILATDSLPGTDPRRMFATGKYQTTISTLTLAKESLGLSGDELYDANMQERVYREYLLPKKRPDLAEFVLRGRGSVDSAQYAAAKEWASIAVPAGFKLGDGRMSDGKMSYYEKSGANSANIAVTNELRQYLIEMEQEMRASR
jgi:hypothetical protein